MTFSSHEINAQVIEFLQGIQTQKRSRANETERLLPSCSAVVSAGENWPTLVSTTFSIVKIVGPLWILSEGWSRSNSSSPGLGEAIPGCMVHDGTNDERQIVQVRVPFRKSMGRRDDGESRLARR